LRAKEDRRRTASTRVTTVTTVAITTDVVRLSGALRLLYCAIELAIPREYWAAESSWVPPA
jgi:hypothetical protein